MLLIKCLLIASKFPTSPNFIQKHFDSLLNIFWNFYSTPQNMLEYFDPSTFFPSPPPWLKIKNVQAHANYKGSILSIYYPLPPFSHHLLFSHFQMHTVQKIFVCSGTSQAWSQSKGSPLQVTNTKGVSFTRLNQPSWLEVSQRSLNFFHSIEWTLSIACSQSRR